MATLNGTPGDDLLEGGSGDDALYGQAGNDTLIGGLGNDYFEGGDGADTIVFAGKFAEYSVVYNSITGQYYITDTVAARDGNDYPMSDVEYFQFADGLRTQDALKVEIGLTFEGTSANDFFLGTERNDVMLGDRGDDTLVGGAGNDWLTSLDWSANDGNDVLQGGSGNDFLEGGTGDDTLMGGPGDDTLCGGDGNGILAADGTDTAIFSGNFADYLIRYDSATNSIIVTDTFANRDGEDWARGIDNFQFADGTRALTYTDDPLPPSPPGPPESATPTVVNGTSGADYIHGTSGDDIIYGFAGNDTLAGGTGTGGADGNDTLVGGAGDDVLYGEQGVNTFVYSGKFADYEVSFDLQAFTVIDTVAGRDGTDTDYGVSWLQFADCTVFWTAYEGGNITGTSGNDTLIGTQLSEIISGDGGNDFISGLGGTDSITGGLGNDTLDGGAGNDVLEGWGGDDVIKGGAGDDQIRAGAGNDVVFGGDGIDTVSFDWDGATSGVTVDLKNGIATGADRVTSLFSVENVGGTNFNDTLIGDAGPNGLSGGMGDDTLTGGGGGDSLYGGGGSDLVIVSGSSGDYWVGYDHVSRTYLMIDSVVNRDGAIWLNEIESIQFTNATVALNQYPLMFLPEGTAGDDLLTGGVGATYYSGLGGNDTLAGGPLNDALDGGDGNDLLEGNNGNDYLHGGPGYDTASYLSAGGPVTVNLAAGTATGAAGTDVLDTLEGVVGGPYADSLTGDWGDNRIDGGAGDDTIVGGAGDDTLIGGDGTDTASFEGDARVTVNLGLTTAQATIGAGTDTLTGFENLRGSSQNDALTGSDAPNRLEGGFGNDFLTGAGGNDTLDGGAGVDLATYAAARSHYMVALNDGKVTVTDTAGAEGTDTLTGVERLGFVDTKLALDIAGNAGAVAKVIGAVFGSAMVANKIYVGAGLEMLDGGASEQDLMQLALNFALGDAPNNAAVVELLYTNIVGTAPSAADRAYFVAMLDSHIYTQAGLGVMAAELSLNASNIHLAGLAATGLEYL